MKLPGKREKPYKLILCCVGQFMVVLDVSVVNVALPSIHADLGFSMTSLQWVVNAYTVLFAGFLLLGGRAADLLPRREVFIAGFVVFSVASLIGGLAPNALTLTFARGIQGLGAAVLAPATLSILTSTFTHAAERSRALGAWAATAGGGGAVGVLLGGLFTGLLDWRWVFLINVPIGLVSIVAARRVIRPDDRGHRDGRKLDIAGAITVSAGLVVLVYGIVTTNRHGWGSSLTLLPMAAGVVLLGLFLATELRFARDPLLPPRVFTRRQLSTANLVVFLFGFAMVSMWYFATLYLQDVLGYGPVEAGLAFLPMATVIAGCSRAAGPLTGRFGRGPVLVAGMVLTATGMMLFGIMPAEGTYLVNVLPPMLVTASGVGLAFVAGTITATTDVAREESGLASGLINTSRQIGGSFGLAILATIASNRTETLTSAHISLREATTSGFHHAFLVGGIVAMVGALVALTLTGSASRVRRQPAGRLQHPEHKP